VVGALLLVNPNPAARAADHIHRELRAREDGFADSSLFGIAKQ
jgi:hypothetical protein